ncbi:MAG TPA: transcription antitermination factor NusB [Candidatus Paceibacterota bacterium]
MAQRHLSRSIALQSLFEWDFFVSSGETQRKISNKNFEDILERNMGEFGNNLLDQKIGGAERDFTRKLALGVLKKRDSLDVIITKAARDWPLAQTPLVDRNVLRIGLYELLFANKDEVPERVAINEAIELGKSFGGERSGKFVNGVLGTIYKEMGEPGKNDEPKKKRKYKRKEDLTHEEKEQLPLKRLVGAVVYHINTKGNTQLALVHDVFGHWTLSKGKVNEDEEESIGVVHKIKEEMNLDILPEAQIGVNEYIATDPTEGNIRKRVTYYLARAKNMRDIKLEDGKGGLDEVKWFNVSEITNLKIYPDVRPIIDNGIQLLNQKKYATDNH